jgi:hypothetical protein
MDREGHSVRWVKYEREEGETCSQVTLSEPWSWSPYIHCRAIYVMTTAVVMTCEQLLKTTCITLTYDWFVCQRCVRNLQVSSPLRELQQKENRKARGHWKNGMVPESTGTRKSV